MNGFGNLKLLMLMFKFLLKGLNVTASFKVEVVRSLYIMQLVMFKNKFIYLCRNITIMYLH